VQQITTTTKKAAAVEEEKKSFDLKRSVFIRQAANGKYETRY
jgi:hypothetical protein